jgi:hypothetical protein
MGGVIFLEKGGVDPVGVVNDINDCIALNTQSPLVDRVVFHVVYGEDLSSF